MVLGIDPSKHMTKSKLKLIYHFELMKYHPDIYRGDKEFAKLFTAKLTTAYQVLLKKVKSV
jgi:DnaJ-class molecular chaperone